MLQRKWSHFCAIKGVQFCLYQIACTFRFLDAYSVTVMAPEVFCLAHTNWRSVAVISWPCGSSISFVGGWCGAVAYLAGVSPLPACESVITSLAVWHVQTCRPPAASRALADTDRLLFLDSELWNPAVILARDSSTIQKACSLASNWHHPSKTY